MPDYTQWATPDDVQTLLKASNITTRFDDADALTDHINTLLLAVQAEVFKKTHRQFIADSSDTERFYDGSGTAEQEVDEMVSLTSVTIIGLQSDPGYTLDNVVLTSEQSLPKTRLIVAQGSLPAYATNAAFLPYRTIFPVGRENIKVTGRFGFGETIPADLWRAVCSEVAYRLAQEVIFRPIGRVQVLKVDTTSTTYKLDSPWVTGWHEAYLQAIGKNGYRRPIGRYLRNLAPRMI